MTQRIPTGISDQYIYFTARDSGGALLTGLTTFTVYRSKNGGTATAYTTPTVAELSASNMAGVYSLLVDEDTTITSGDNVNMMALYITQASMVPVIEIIEIYRTVVTAGQTLTVASGNISALNASTITAASIASDAITDAKVASDVTIASVTGAVGSVTAAVTLPTIPADWITSSGLAASAVTEIQSGLSTLDASGVRAAVGLASADLDTQLATIAAAIGSVPSDVWTTVIEAGYSAEEIVRLLASYAVGTATGLNGSAAFTGLDGATQRITGTVDGVNRTITALDAA